MSARARRARHPANELPSLVALTASACAIGMPQTHCKRPSLAGVQSPIGVRFLDLPQDLLMTVVRLCVSDPVTGVGPLLACVSKRMLALVRSVRMRREVDLRDFGCTRVLWQSPKLLAWALEKPRSFPGGVALDYRGAYVAARLSAPDVAVAVLERAWLSCRPLMLDALGKRDFIDFADTTGAVTIEGIGAVAASVGNLKVMEWVDAKRDWLKMNGFGHGFEYPYDSVGAFDHTCAAAVYGKNERCIKHAYDLVQASDQNGRANGWSDEEIVAKELDRDTHVAKAAASAGDAPAFTKWLANKPAYEFDEWAGLHAPVGLTYGSPQAYEGACVEATNGGHFELLERLLAHVVQAAPRAAASDEEEYEDCRSADGFIHVLFDRLHKCAASGEHGARPPLGPLPLYASPALTDRLATLTNLSPEEEAAREAVANGRFDTDGLQQLYKNAVYYGRVANARHIRHAAGATAVPWGRPSVSSATLERMARSSQMDEADELMEFEPDFCMLDDIEHLRSGITPDNDNAVPECLGRWFTGAACTFSTDCYERARTSSVCKMALLRDAEFSFPGRDLTVQELDDHKEQLERRAWALAACNSGNTDVLRHAVGWCDVPGRLWRPALKRAARAGQLHVFLHVKRFHHDLFEHVQQIDRESQFHRIALREGRLNLAKWFEDNGFEHKRESGMMTREAQSEMEQERTKFFYDLTWDRLWGTLQHVLHKLWRVQSVQSTADGTALTLLYDDAPARVIAIHNSYAPTVLALLSPPLEPPLYLVVRVPQTRDAAGRSCG
jgi:hypothetical protein